MSSTSRNVLIEKKDADVTPNSKHRKLEHGAVILVLITSRYAKQGMERVV